MKKIGKITVSHNSLFISEQSVQRMFASGQLTDFLGKRREPLQKIVSILMKSITVTVTERDIHEWSDGTYECAYLISDLKAIFHQVLQRAGDNDYVILLYTEFPDDYIFPEPEKFGLHRMLIRANSYQKDVVF